MRLHALIPLAAAIANLAICFPVIRRGVRQPIIATFAWMTLTIVAWDLDIFALYYFTDVVAAEWWSRVFRVGICFAPVAAFHLAVAISATTIGVWRGLLIGGYTGAFLLSVANLAGALVTGLKPHSWGWYPVPTHLYAGVSLLLVVYLPLTVERLWYGYRHADTSRARAQAKFCLLAAVVQTPFALTNLLPMYGFNVYPVGNIGNVAYVSIVAYAIVRHRIMDVDYVVRKIVSFLVAGSVVLVPGGAGIAWLNVVLGSHEPMVLTCAALTLALLAVILIPTFQEALETRVHRALFPSLYDYRLRLRQLAASLVHVLDQGQLVKELGESLTDILDVDSCCIFARDEQTRRLMRVYPPGGEPEGMPEDAARSIDSLSEAALTSELTVESTPAATFFRSRAWEVALPLRIDQRLTGFVALGRNRDFRIFSGEDLQLLGAVAAGASVALENASLSRQLRRSEQVLERANQLSSLGMLAAGIAHEIRNPLVAVKTFLDLLPQRLDDREFLTQFRDLSLSELRRVTDLITDLLALGKSKTADRREIEIAPTLEPVLRLMESSARKRQVAVNVRLAPNLPAIWGDSDQLKQIALNLLLNAIESSAPGSPVALEVRALRDVVVLEVRDHGAGIPADQLETIFHPFFTTKESGTGLGLALVHQMIVEHGGQITVESVIGHGTTFRVTLPRAQQMRLAETGS
jgi:two-component system, NtrC family, sensor kinase